MKAMICEAATIGEMSIIAEQSLVRKQSNIPPGKIAAGSPARVFENYRAKLAKRYRGQTAPQHIVSCVEAAVNLPKDTPIRDIHTVGIVGGGTMGGGIAMCFANSGTPITLLEIDDDALVNEGINILQEGIAQRPGDIDVVYVFGYGFPAYRGGPMHYADTIGLKNVYDTICSFREIHGDKYWQPATLLKQLVQENKTLDQWAAEQI